MCVLVCEMEGTFTLNAMHHALLNHFFSEAEGTTHRKKNPHHLFSFLNLLFSESSSLFHANELLGTFRGHRGIITLTVVI